MPTNESKLKAKLVELGMTYALCAKKMGISTNTFTKKVNNVDKFSVTQVNQLSEILGLTQEEKVAIFLS